MVQKEKNSFAGQAHLMNYKEIADRGWPIGSGPIESICPQDQCRFKRPANPGTEAGLANLVHWTRPVETITGKSSG